MNTTIEIRLIKYNTTNAYHRTSAAPIARYDRKANRRAIAIAKAAAIEVLG